MSRRALATAAALLFCACSRGRAPQPAVPLLAVADAPSVVWPAGCEPPKGIARPADELAPFFAGTPAIRRLRLGVSFKRDERVSLLAPAGVRYSIPFEVPRDSALHTSVGRLAAGGPLVLAASIVESGRDAVALEDRKLEGGGTEHWEEVQWDLERWGGRKVTLELAATSPDATPAAAGCGEAIAAWSAPRLAPNHRSPDPRPNVIWVSVDTLRADRLGVYGGKPRTSPELDKFAAAGVRFAWAISQSPWTKPSHRAMLSGLYPSSRAGNRSPYIGAPLFHAGYRTFAMTGAGQVDSAFGFDRGFEIYRLHDWIHDPAEAIGWIAERTDGPFFAFLHTYEAHEPYTHDEYARGMPSGRLGTEFSKQVYNQLHGHLTDEEKDYARAMYEGDISYTDRRLGELFRTLAAHGYMENSIVIVTSDHGEQLWDHGTWGHGQSMHDHQIHVPLLIHLPPGLKLPEARVEEDQIELVDLYPTVLDLAGVPLDHAVQGRSMRKLLEAAGPLPPKMAYAEHTNIRTWEKRALRTPKFKFVLWERRKSPGEENPRYELYDLRADPGELNDLYGQFPERALALRAEIERRKAGSDDAVDEEVPEGINEELRKQLEALGYIGN